jgi:hypothetical protein
MLLDAIPGFLLDICRMEAIMVSMNLLHFSYGRGDYADREATSWLLLYTDV